MKESRAGNLDHCKIDKRMNLLFKMGVVVILLSVVYLFISKGQLVNSNANTQVNVRIDYIEELAYVTSYTGSYKFYMSTDKMKNWELLDTSGVVDLSTILSSKPVTVYFKGNNDTNPVEIILEGEDNTLQAKYEVIEGVGRITYTAAGAVEYRKGNNGAWKTAYNNIFTSIYEIKGATLSFRTAATATKRAGKVVSVKIPKRPSAPSVKVDGGKFYITGLKSGVTQYRVNNDPTWKTFQPTDTKVKTLDLRELLSQDLTTNTIKAGVIEFRNLGTGKKLTSAIKVIEIPQQLVMPGTVSLIGTTLSVADTDTKRSYEYTRVEGNATFDLNKARWTTFSSKKSVIVPKAAVGDKIYVRLKATTDSATKQTILASTYIYQTVTSITMK